MAGRQISGTCQIAVTAQLLAQERRVPQNRGGGLARHRQGLEQRLGNDHPGHLALVLHAGVLFEQPGIHGQGCRLRAQSAETAARRLYPRVERSDRPRCPRPTGPYQSPDADHLRPPRPSVRAALCRHVDERNQGERTCCVRDLLARTDLPKHRRVQREDLELP